jgi:5-methyltetrahydropteroyltriglutamate--homocysteine methyltransferase
VTVVSDGEASKIGYSTYVKERLEGFGGASEPGPPPADLQEFPEYMESVMGRRDAAMPACVGPLSYRDRHAIRTDIANLETALDGVGSRARPASTRRSPGRSCERWPTGRNSPPSASGRAVRPAPGRVVAQA